LEIPLVIRINQAYALDLRANLSEILSVDYVGALAGALLFTYVLLVNFSLAEIGFLLGLVNVVVALVGFVLFHGLLERRFLMGSLILVAGAALGLGYVRAEDWTRFAEQRYYKDPVVAHLTTPYQHLVLTKKEDRVRFYINGHLQFSSKDEQIYHEMLVHPALHLVEQRGRILILGGGDGLALRETLKYPDVEHVTLVDIDREVVRLAREQPDLVRLNQGAFHDRRVYIHDSEAAAPGALVSVFQKSERASEMFTGRRYPLAQVHVVIMDAERFIRETEGAFDAVFIDLPDPDELELAKLYSVNFYALLREKLAPGAMVAVQATSPYYAKKVFLCIGRTLRAAGFHTLPYHDNVPSFGEWGWYLAWSSAMPPAVAAKRLRSLDGLKVEMRYLTPALIRAALDFGKGWLDPESEIMVNSFLNPVIIEYFREAWKGV
jgi:spermidine synthase